jgi:hypothetical protein
MQLRWVSQPEKKKRTGWGCCGVLLLGALGWYAATGLAVWMLVQLPRADEGEVRETYVYGALLTPAVLLALLPLFMWNYRLLWRRLFRSDDAGAVSSSPPPLPPPPSMVPAAGRERMTPDGPRYRLRPSLPDGLGLIGCAFLCGALAVAAAGPFAVVGRLGERLGWTGDRLSWLFTLAWIALGLALPAAVFALVVGVSRYLVFRARSGRRGPAARLELTAHPLRPGGRCTLHLTQPGHGAYASFEVRLVCVEEVKRGAGVLQTDSRRVRETVLFRRDAPVIQQDLPLTAAIDLEIPSDAMHSFQTASHAISWRLLVELRPESGAFREQSFPVIVYPPEAVGGPT